ncbi:MAG: C25 family cysteine peptidase [Candidatus Cryptobacteroides sp.]
MKFCFNCGASLSGTEKFCPKCGQRLAPAAQPPVTSDEQPGGTPEHKPQPTAGTSAEQPVGATGAGQGDKARTRKRDCSRHGIIFTDTKALSSFMKCNLDDLKFLFEKYAEFMALSDIDYRMVDVSDYTFVSKAAGRRGEKASMNVNSPWWDYQHVLYDVMCYEKEHNLPESNYLFIIGGHEIIPVPVINHYIPPKSEYDDKDIETDLLYCYPYGPHTQYSLESGEIFTQEMYFFAGRLPIPEGVGPDYLRNYLQNAVNCRNGLPVKKIYSQTDPHWKELTAWIMSPYNKAGMLPDRSHISGKYSYGNVMLGPDVTSKDIHSVMDKDTDLIFLNLHGSNAPETGYYLGEFPQHSCKYAPIFPVEAMLIPEGYNVFVSEACYGGRFVGYDMTHSMVQAGLSNKTIIAVASSRVAYGGPTPPGGNADTLCGMFVAYLLSGYSSGEAFVLARAAFFNEEGMLSPYQAATITEFNLYGDPSLHAIGVAEDGSKVASVSKRMAPADFPVGYEMETVKSASGEQSLLERVRSAVDANLMEISRSIGNSLYAQYGLTPREPQTIRRLKYRNGKQRLVYTYANGDSSWVVTATPEGNIETVMTSKNY